MTAANEQREAAAAARRQAATEVRHDHGDRAFRAYRAAAPGVGSARQVPTRTEIRAATETRNGKEMIHTFGYFTRYDTPYPMWDMFGEYDEVVMTGAGRETIESGPDVAWLVNHKGVTMARTRNNTLELEERREGGWHDAWLNPDRTDVRDIVSAIRDGLVDQMSFAFMIPEGRGEWTEDFERFLIHGYDIDRGDVSAVNYGASPYTDITARTAEVLADLDHLPQGALPEAYRRLQQRGLSLPPRDRIVVDSGARVGRLIDESSLGTPEARELRESVPAEVAEGIVERSKVPAEPKGRSIALIEAQLAVEESR